LGLRECRARVVPMIWKPVTKISGGGALVLGEKDSMRPESGHHKRLAAGTPCP